MLRVAALAQIILENWTGKKVNKKAVIEACLVHDLAKPITFDLKKQSRFALSPSEISGLKKLQESLKSKFGNQEYRALLGIAKEIGLSSTATNLLEYFDWNYLPALLKAESLEKLIPIYCDMRISPQGILPLKARLQELETRVGNINYKKRTKEGCALQRLIQKNTKVNLEKVTNKQLSNRFIKLFNLQFLIQPINKTLV